MKSNSVYGRAIKFGGSLILILFLTQAQAATYESCICHWGHAHNKCVAAVACTASGGRCLKACRSE